VPDVPVQLILKDYKEMVHKHSYVTLKPIPVCLPTGQNLAFLSPTILMTVGKVQMFFSIYGHLQLLKNRRAIQLMLLLIRSKITSDTG
jgi:hypothetical protein